MNIVKQLENAPRNLILYVLGLIGAVVDDYTLVTLTIFSVLLGFVVGSILIGLTVFFGGYFILRLVANIAEVIGLNARASHQAADMVAHSNTQIAAAIAQATTRGQVVDGEVLP